jgi:hypothetical protein
MDVSCQFSLYPLGRADLGPAIDARLPAVRLASSRLARHHRVRSARDPGSPKGRSTLVGATAWWEAWE